MLVCPVGFVLCCLLYCFLCSCFVLVGWLFCWRDLQWYGLWYDAALFTSNRYFGGIVDFAWS